MSDVRKLAKTLARIESSQRHSVSAPQLAHSSLEDGAIDEYDLDGTLVGSYGKQFDGSHIASSLAGPKPAIPVKASVEVGALSVTIRWNGKFIEDAVSTMDHKHVAVHITQHQDEAPSHNNHRGVIVGELGDVLTTAVPAGHYWVTLVAWTRAGRYSDPSESVLFEMKPLVDDTTIKAALDAAKEELEAATQEANQKLSAFNTRQDEFNQAMTQAEKDIEEAKSTLAPIPADLAEAKAEVTAAKNAAIAAEARATEANNRAMTRLANGNFEAGLQYWKEGPWLVDDSHSGVQAVRITSTRTLSPESTLPVVAGQIWELQAYYKPVDASALSSKLAIEFMENGQSPHTTLKTASAMEWTDSGAVRLTVAEGVDTLGLRIRPVAGTWHVDDVVLRDVTDVVRLEAAAQEAKAAGDAAQSKATFVELQLDGVKGRLTDAEKAIPAAVQKAEEELGNLDVALKAADTALSGRISTEQGRVNTLVNTTIPTLNTALNTEKGRLDTLANTTIPALANRVQVEEAKLKTLRDTTIPDLQSSLSASQGELSTLKNTTIPALTQRTTAAEGRLSTAEDKVNTLQNTTIPGLQSSLNTLSGTTIPGLNSALDAARDRLNTIEPVLEGKLDTITGPTGNRTIRDVYALYWSASAGAGSIVVETAIPVTSSIMGRIRFQGAELSRDGTIDVTVSFYAYNNNGGYIHSPKATSDGERQMRVRMGTTAAGNIAVILTPEDGRSWAYPRITATEYQMGYINRPETATGWTHREGLSEATLEADYTDILTPATRDLEDSYNLTQEWRTSNGGRTLRGDKLEANSVKALQVDAQSVAGAVGTFLRLNADQLTAGTIATARLDAEAVAAAVGSFLRLNANQITAGKIASGQIDTTGLSATLATIISLDATRIVSGKIATARIDATSLSAEIAKVIQLDAARITSGSIKSGQIDTTGLSASLATILSLDASRITSGQIKAARIDVSNLAASMATVITLDAGRITSGKISTARLDAQAVAALTASFQTVTTDNILSGTGTFSTAVAQKMYAGMVAANDVFARRMVVSEGNLFPDPNFVNGLGTWSVVNGGIERVGNGGQLGSYAGGIEVKAGDSFRVEVDRTTMTGTLAPNQVRWIVRAEYTDGTTGWPVAWINQEGANSATVTATKDGKFSFGFFLEAAATSAHRIRLSNPRVLRMTGTTLIEPGAVTADKITVTNELITDIFGANRALIEDELVVKGKLFANNASLISASMETLTVTQKANFANAFATQFAANSAFIDKLTATSAWIGGALIKDNAITVAKINVTSELTAQLLSARKVRGSEIDGNTFTGQIFNGGTFNGALFQSQTATNRGVKMDNSGFRAFDNSGTRTFDVSSSGAVSIEGDLIRRATVTPDVGAVPYLGEIGLRNGPYGPGVYGKVGGQDVGGLSTHLNGIYLSGPVPANWDAGGFFDISDSGWAIITSGMFSGTAAEYSSIQVAPTGLNLFVVGEGDIELNTGLGGELLGRQNGGTQGPISVTEEWRNVPYANGWNTQSGFSRLRVRREGDRAWLEGRVIGGTANAVIGTIPAGLRPPRHQSLRPLTYSGSNTLNDSWRLDIGTSGAISTAGWAGTYISLDGLSWPLS